MIAVDKFLEHQPAYNAKSVATIIVTFCSVLQTRRDFIAQVYYLILGYVLQWLAPVDVLNWGRGQVKAEGRERGRSSSGSVSEPSPQKLRGLRERYRARLPIRIHGRVRTANTVILGTRRAQKTRLVAAN